MRILVYPHSMELGGSQLNAIELAAATRDRGHDVIVYSEDGPLLSRVEDLGLQHVRSRRARFRPGLTIARDLARLVDERAIDIVHGWEWPPILEAYAAAAKRPSTAVVGSVMSMSVAPFIPSGVPLTVGTERIREACQLTRWGHSLLLEPPVDTEANRPGLLLLAPPGLTAIPYGPLRVVVVSRLAAELKLEGILTAVAAVAQLAARRDVQLVIVGDGPGRSAVEQAASSANQLAGREVVFLTGEMADPRPAYESAGVCVGMGGSALRSLAFAKPLVVQGEGGFFETLGPDNADYFLVNGWYGVSERSSNEASDHLVAQLESLLDDVERRTELGRFGRRLVEERFSLRGGAAVLERLYLDALDSSVSWGRIARDASRSGRGLLRYKLNRRLERSRGEARADDFNARPT